MADFKLIRSVGLTQLLRRCFNVSFLTIARKKAHINTTEKIHVYELVAKLNHAFGLVVSNCQGLQHTGAFDPEHMEMFQGFVKELQSEINHEIVERLHEIEDYDWARHGKVRIEREKYLKDPDDVFIEAEHRKQELLKADK